MDRLVCSIQQAMMVLYKFALVRRCSVPPLPNRIFMFPASVDCCSGGATICFVVQAHDTFLIMISFALSVGYFRRLNSLISCCLPFLQMNSDEPR
jgi:hypothetical protein